MTKDGNERGIPWWRHPIRATNAWLDEPERTRRESLLIGILGTLLLTVWLTVIGVLLAAITVVDFEGEVPTWLVLGMAFLAFGVGGVTGALVVRRFHYRHKLATAAAELAASEEARNESEGAKRQAEGELERAEKAIALAREEVAELEFNRDIRIRIESYAEQVRLLLSRGLGTGLEDVEEELLAQPAKLIDKMTGVEVHLSVWEPVRIDGGPASWHISHGPDHTDRECTAFSVRLDASWIAYTQKQRSDDAVFGLGDLDARQGASGDDVTAFREAGFRALLCSRVATGPLTGEQRRDNTACLVALARKPHAFSQVESRYLQFLGRLLSLHFQIVDLMQRLDAGEPPGLD